MLELFFKPRLTELGKIKIGGKGEERTSAKGNKWRLPLKLDHFIITTMQRDGAGNLEPDLELMGQLAEEYGTAADDNAKGGEPGVIQSNGDLKVLRQIPIRLLSNDPEDVMQSAHVWYGGKTVGARSDGETVTWFNDPKNGRRLGEPKTEPWSDNMLDLTDSRKAKLFKLHTAFNCVVAAKEARWGGVYKFRTTSVITGGQLYGSLTQLSQLTGGVLMGMPLVLVVRPMQVTPDGKATTIYVVHVELRGPDLQAIQNQALEQMRYLVANKGAMQRTQRQYKALLVAPGQETSEAEIIDMEAEFHTVQPSKDELAPPAEPDPLLQRKEVSAQEVAEMEGVAEPTEYDYPEQAQPPEEASPFQEHQDEVVIDRDAYVDEISDFLESASDEECAAFKASCEKMGKTLTTWTDAGDGALEKLLGQVRDLVSARA